MKKKLLSLVLFSALTVSTITGCGAAKSAEAAAPAAEAAEAESVEVSEAAESEAAESEAAGPVDGDNVITIGATPVPHAEILEDVVKPLLEAEGWELDVVVFEDYVQPNTAVEEGELDANYFQTTRYMNEENSERGLHLVSIGGVHLEPMGLYANTATSIEELPDGASIAIPNDGTNEARALRLLVDNGLIEVNEEVELLTPVDVTVNEHNFEFVEVEAASLTRTLEDVDAAVINGNYALGAGLNPAEDTLVLESVDSDSIQQYINNLVVKEGNEETAKSQALLAALQSQDVVDYINEKYAGSVIPAGN